MTTSNLSFEPKFHQYVELGESKGWTVSIPPFGSVLSFALEISAEQRRIQAEGGTIVVIDFKHER